MQHLRSLLSLLALTVSSGSTALVQGNCTAFDPALARLEQQLSDSAAISCLGQPLQLYNANRYWGTQFGKNASVVVFPMTTRDVSYTIRAANQSPLGEDSAFVSGGHSQINASSAYGSVTDLSWLNETEVLFDFTSDGKWHGNNRDHTAVNGSGFTPVGARVADVGVGGFSTGGGIGFLAGAYGYAIDRLVQLEVVLPYGDIVTATKTNEYADLFWAFQGGSGQFGIVTRFWQEAAPEPTDNTIAFYYIPDSDVDRLRQNTVDFFESNDDPFSVLYYSFGYLPSSLADPIPPPSSYAKRTLLITLRFGNLANPAQKSYNETFAPVFEGLDTSNGVVITGPYANLVLIGSAAYPSGFRRGFYGPQTTNISVEYLANLTDAFNDYIDVLQARGDTPYSASFVMQYMFPGLNGNLPASDADTAWPHAVAGHQTLFTPAYLDYKNDQLSLETTDALNRITYDQQAKVGGFLADYPNYISPGSSGERVWGANVERLKQVKQKYDPGCLIRNGRAFASFGCIAGGWANVFGGDVR